MREIIETAKRDRKDSFEKIKEHNQNVSPVRKGPEISKEAHDLAEE